MRVVVAAAVGLLALLGARPSWGEDVEPVRLPDGSAIERRRVRPPRRQPVRPARLQRRGVPRVVPGAGRAEPEPLRPRPGARLRARSPATPSAAGSTSSTPTAAWSCSRPTGRVPHEGGPRFRGRLVGVSGHPRLDRRRGPGATRRGRRSSGSRSAPAPWTSDGRAARAGSRSSPGSPTATEADVTPFCDLRVRDDAVAEVALGGEVRGLRPGDTAVVASYNGRLASARVVGPHRARRGRPRRPGGRRDRPRGLRQAPGPGRRALGAGDRRRVPPPGHARRRRHAAHPAGGPRLPPRRRRGQAVAEGRRAARAPDARRALGHAVPRHHRLRRRRDGGAGGAPRPAGRGCGTTGSAGGSPTNTPYTEIARGVLTATSRDGGDADAWAAGEAARMIALKDGAANDYASRPGLDLFWRRFADGEYVAVEPLAERTAAAFLGVRLECAQCHKHPFDRWTQADYRAFANVVRRRAVRALPRGPVRRGAAAGAAAEVGPERHAAADPPAARDLRLRASLAAAGRPRDRPAARARALGGPELPASGDPREGSSPG